MTIDANMSIAFFSVDGGTAMENTLLQNVQARQRMVVSYMLAAGERRLVLATGNNDECLTGLCRQGSISVIALPVRLSH